MQETDSMTSVMLVDANVKLYDHPITRLHVPDSANQPCCSSGFVSAIGYAEEVKKSRHIGSQQLLVEFCMICQNLGSHRPHYSYKYFLEITLLRAPGPHCIR